MRIWVQSSGCLFFWYGKYYCKMLRNKWRKWLSSRTELILLLKTMPNLLYCCSLIFKLHHRQPYSNMINFDKTGWTGIPVPSIGKENKINTHGPWYCSIVAPLSKTTSTKHSWFAVIFGIAKIQSNHQTLQKSNKSIVWSISSKCIHAKSATKMSDCTVTPPFGSFHPGQLPSSMSRSVRPGVSRPHVTAYPLERPKRPPFIGRSPESLDQRVNTFDLFASWKRRMLQILFDA